MNLRISSTLSLPSDAVTQTFGCIGRKGSGKTYLAGVLAEQMLDMRAQIIVLDPVGNWWGLRVDADGKSKGKSIFVIGGEHGDIPITVESGAKIARVLVEKGVSAVLDISSFRQGERKRFAADFAEEFFHLKKTQRSAVHLFVEEAQLFVPQRCGPDEARMLGAYENIIRLGRNYGIGATLISQRPQSVNKEVLSQVECLCVLQVNGAHERKSLEEWVQEAGADRKLVGQLPGLGRGEGFVWSPSWLRVFERVKFAKKTTFDASATPEVGKATKTALLSTVDVEGLKSQLKEVIQQAEKDDPKALRKRIAELEKLAAKPAVAPSQQPDVTASLRNRIQELESYSGGLAKVVDTYRSRWSKQAASSKFLRELATALEDGSEVQIIPQIPKQFAPTNGRAAAPAPHQALPVPAKSVRASQSSGTLTGPEQRILNAIAWLESIGVKQPEQPAVAFLAGYTYGGGAYNNPRGRLNVNGLVEYVPGERIQLTDEGRKMAEFPDDIVSNDELHGKVLGRLPGPEGRLLRPLLKAYPDSLTNEELAIQAQYEVGGGAFNNPKGRLRTLGLIEYPTKGVVRARDLLFPM